MVFLPEIDWLTLAEERARERGTRHTMVIMGELPGDYPQLFRASGGIVEKIIVITPPGSKTSYSDLPDNCSVDCAVAGSYIEQIVQTIQSCIDRGENPVLVKGAKVGSADFDRACFKLRRHGGFISHVSSIVVKTVFGSGVIIATDGGVNTLLDPKRVHLLQDDLRRIAINAIEAAKAMYQGVLLYAGFITANEIKSPSIPTSQVMAAITDDSHQEICGVPTIGPCSLDVASDEDVAREKGVDHPAAGKVSIYIFACINTANVFTKVLRDWFGAKLTGFIAGAIVPIAMTSRTDSWQTRLRSIAAAICAHQYA